MTEKLLMFRLLTGQQVMAGVIGEEPDFYSVENALQVSLLSDGKGQQAVQFQVVMFGTGKTIRIFKVAISAVSLEIEPELERVYREKTSGLVLPGRR